MDNDREQSLLKLSIAMTAFVAGIGIVFGLWAGSQSIIFDGFFSLIDSMMTVVALIVSKLVTREGSQRFQYGFWHLEPLVAGFNGAIMALICTYAFINGVDGLRKGGHRVNFELAILYAAFGSSICFAMCLYVRRQNRALKSELLRVDAHGWLMGGTLSGALCISFLAAALITGTGLDPLTAYVDPTVLTALSLLLIPLPIGIIWRAVREVFLVAPADLDRHTRDVMEEIAARYGFAKYRSYVAKTGRADLIEISIVTPPDFGTGGVADLDRIRQEIADALGQASRQRWLTITFTADEKWA
ncbi:MAG: cation efflux family transporter [Rhodospirillaceae bacterium]|nr:MAG: cation efflux family transporter [Rhodospirillaceae bacterium]